MSVRNAPCSKKFLIRYFDITYIRNIKQYLRYGCSFRYQIGYSEKNTKISIEILIIVKNLQQVRKKQMEAGFSLKDHIKNII